MKQNKWPDFLFTITVRFAFGILLGALACFLFSWRGILRVFAHNNTHVPLIWLGLCGLIGGIVAVFTVPRWQTPWYKRDSIALDLSSGLASANLDPANPAASIVKRSVTIKTVSDGGEQREYSSIEDLPPEIRSEIEALEKQAARGNGNELSVTGTSQSGDAVTLKTIHRNNISIYKIIDDSGVERVYHSLEKMPPEIRAAFTEAENQAGYAGDKT